MDKYFSFFNPVFDYLDSGKLFRQPFRILYYIIGLTIALGCLFSIGLVFDFIKDFNAAAYIYAVVGVMVLVASAVFSFIYWWKRAQDINTDVSQKSRFQAIPAVSGLIINLGEWIGVVGAAITFVMGVVGAVILPMAEKYGNSHIFWKFIMIAVLGPIVAYIFWVIFRLIGEQILAIGTIASETRKIAEKK